jgi:tRNA pseudouridine38-40 synthase
MRFFIEVSYKGTNYAGFQVQENAPTIQLEVEKALAVFYKRTIKLTGSSRTDSGVHAWQNYFQMDEDMCIEPKHVYNLNAILPADIVIKRIFEVDSELHCRFHATYRRYQYFIYQQKDPFKEDRAWHYPYPVDVDILQQTASILTEYNDFTSFSKRNTQTFTKLCTIMQSEWVLENGMLVYHVKANRFLRGMVRALVATQLLAARKRISIDQFRNIIEAKSCEKANFAAPPHGLFLVEVGFGV